VSEPEPTAISPAGGVRTSLRGVGLAIALTWRAGWYLPPLYGGVMLLEAAVPVSLAWLTKLALDIIVDPAAPASLLLGLGLGLAVTGVVAVLLPHLSGFLKSEIERRVGLLSQDELFAALERFVGLARFENPAFLDRLRLAQQSGGKTPATVVSGVFSIGSATVTILGFLASLLVISPWMALAVLLAAIPAFIAELQLSRRRAAMMWRIGPMERREIFFRELLSSVQAAKELRLFGVGSHLRRRMYNERRTANAEYRSMDVRELLTQSALGLLSAGIAGAGLVWVIFAAADGRVTVGDVALFIQAVAGVQAALVNLVREITMAHHELLMFDHYLKVRDSGPELPVAAAARPVPALRRGIEFRDVWFRYAPEHPWVLRGAKLSIPHGSSVALIGRNGSGKSTLVKLLCRMYDPQHGQILWDGVDLRDMDPAELRSRIGAAFQDYMTYDLSAAENIGLGDLDQLDDTVAVEKAARRAGVHEKLAGLPRGYETLLTRIFFDGDTTSPDDAGVPLSGGQWQRLALARAYLRGQRDLLILDEPSSGLDAEAEYEIHSGLRTARRGRTSLLISHRLGAVRDADVLVVLDEGRAVESGTHSELLETGGVYAQLFGLQAQGYQAVGSGRGVGGGPR
jgi:ATP-binding cassette, subfamily B, bacterial